MIGQESGTKALETRYEVGVYPKRDVVIVRGQGATLWDEDGREYIDCVGGQGSVNIGHAHPAIGARGATWEKKYREPFQPLMPGVRHVPFDNLEALEKAVSETTAAVLLEPVQGEGGVRPASPGYLRAAAELCRERGALLIDDEV